MLLKLRPCGATPVLCASVPVPVPVSPVSGSCSASALLRGAELPPRKEDEYVSGLANLRMGSCLVVLQF